MGVEKVEAWLVYTKYLLIHWKHRRREFEVGCVFKWDGVSKHTGECVQAQLLGCVWLSDPMDCSLPASSVHGIFQAKILEWGAISFSKRSSQPRDWTWVSHIIGRFFYCLSHQGSSYIEIPRLHRWTFCIIIAWLLRKLQITLPNSPVI